MELHRGSARDFFLVRILSSVTAVVAQGATRHPNAVDYAVAKPTRNGGGVSCGGESGTALFLHAQVNNGFRSRAEERAPRHKAISSLLRYKQNTQNRELLILSVVHTCLISSLDRANSHPREIKGKRKGCLSLALPRLCFTFSQQTGKIYSRSGFNFASFSSAASSRRC